MIYVHIPFCLSRCSFCDWVVDIPSKDLFLRPSDFPRQRYVDALCLEIAHRGGEVRDTHRPVAVFFGGGTASSLSHEELTQIMGTMRDSFNLSDVQETTMECSPDTVNTAMLADLRALGFNRVSSGVQTFNEERLRRLGRRHSSAQSVQFVHDAYSAGFENISIDLMCGLPGQSLRELHSTVAKTRELPLSHLSLYPFRPTAGTNLRRQTDKGRLMLDVHQQVRDFILGRRWLAEVTGLQEYALGYFGQGGRESLFTEHFFRLTADTLGVGSGASSYLNGQFQLHLSGRLHEYNMSPLRLDVDTPLANPRMTITLLRAALTHFKGVSRRAWHEATHQELHDALADPSVAPLIDHLRLRGLVETDDAIWMDSDSMARILVELNYQINTASLRSAV